MSESLPITVLPTLLLRDAVALTIANPGSSHSWHRLKDRYLSVDDAAFKKGLIDDLLVRTPADGEAGFLRATWLASMLHGETYLAEAGRILQNITPFAPDRLVAFMSLAWSRILSRAKCAAAFSQAVHDTLLPQLLQSLGQYLAQQITLRPQARKIASVKKIALVTPVLSSYPHAPTLIVLHHARLLIDQGIEVALFSCREFVVPDMMHFLGARESTMMDAFDAVQWSAQCPPGLKIYQGNEQFSVMARWGDMLHHIAGFDPDLVLSVGFYSPLVAPLFEVRPVVGLNVHCVAPLDPVDVWLCAAQEDAGQAHAPGGYHLPDRFGWYHPYRIRRKPPIQAISRQTLGLSEAALVLISVGYRLETEIDGAWAARMVELLKAQPNVTWLLVGGTGTRPPALAQVSALQVLVLSAHGDIPAVLQCCDIYVNPPRMGGGFSVAEAMAEGLPVVTHDNSDGGRKVGSAGVCNDAAYFSKLALFIANPDLRQQQGAAMRTLFSATLDLDQSGPGLLSACDLALQRFLQRTTPVIS